jgi:hypothetical protein
MIDLYLDPDFTVEGNDFAFKAHDDDKKDYIVRVAFDDLAAWLEVPSEDITKISISNTEKTTISGTCQQIVDRFKTGATSYKVKIKLADGSITRIQATELLKAAPSDEKYTIEINDAFNGDGTAKTILKWFSIGCLRAVWDDDLVLLKKKESKAPKIPTFKETAERQKKSASYWKTWDEEYGETMHHTEEEKDLIQKLNN